MARYLKQHEGVEVSHNFVSVLWRENGIKPHRQGTFKLSRDPDFAAKVVDVVGLYLEGYLKLRLKKYNPTAARYDVT